MTEQIEVQEAAPAKQATRARDLFATRKDLGGYIDPRIIKIQPGFNVRDYRLPENRAMLDSLKEQIRAYGGVYKALIVRYDAGQAILVDGESRLTATLELIHEGMQIDSVPCQVVTTKDEAELLVLSVGSNGGKAFSVWELGIAYKRFEKMGWDEKKIAQTFGVSTKAVRQAIDAADLPMDAKKLMSERAITPALAIDTVRRKGSKAGVEELQAKAAKHKAEGKKGPVKAAKGASKKTNEWEEAGRKLYKSVEAVMLQMQEPGAEKFDWVEVGTPLIKKLGKLYNGEK